MLEITKDDGTGSTWEYSCFYQEDKDCLAPISSSRINFTTDLNTGDRIPGETAYDGDEEKGTEFTIDADGTCTVFKKNAEGEYITEDDGETYNAVFSKMENGRVLLEADNGIEMEYDMEEHVS